MAKGKGKVKGQGQGNTKVIFKNGETMHKAYSRVYHSAYTNAMQEGTSERAKSRVRPVANYAWVSGVGTVRVLDLDRWCVRSVCKWYVCVRNIHGNTKWFAPVNW